MSSPVALDSPAKVQKTESSFGVSSSSVHVYLHLVAQALVFIFVIVMSIIILGFKGKPLLGLPQVTGILYLMSGLALLASVYLLSKSRMFLPFLGEAVFPTSVLVPDEHLCERTIASRPLRVTVNTPDTPDGYMVVYWASNPSANTISTPQEAYKDTKNAGVARIMDGSATLLLACPSQYKVMGNRTLKRHVHYRIQSKLGSGMFGPVKTMDVHC